MSITSAPSHWNLGTSEYQQLAALIANRIQDHFRAVSSGHSTSSESIQQETQSCYGVLNRSELGLWILVSKNVNFCIKKDFDSWYV